MMRMRRETSKLGWEWEEKQDKYNTRLKSIIMAFSLLLLFIGIGLFV